MDGIKKSIFHAFLGKNENYDPYIFIEAIKDHSEPFCIMLDEVDNLAKKLLARRMRRDNEKPHQMQGYYDVLDAFQELSRICTVILAGKSPLLYLVGRGIYRTGLPSQCLVDHVVLQSLKEDAASNVNMSTIYLCNGCYKERN